MVETFHSGLIILDVIMESPDDGFLLAQQLRHEGWKMPILMMSSIGKVSGMAYQSHENLVILRLYHHFLAEGPCGYLSHRLLHTHYTPRGKFIV